MKIFLALSCLMSGCTLVLTAQSVLLSDAEWLIPVFNAAGFMVIMVSGLYTLLKVVKAFVYRRGPSDISKFRLH